MKEKYPFEEELCLAGEVSPVSPLAVKLDKYEKTYNLAIDQRVMQSTMARNGRIVVVLLPS